MLIVQLEGLGDGCQRLRNSFSANLIFSSGVSSSYPSGKGLDEGKLLRLGQGMEEWVTESKEGDELGPVFPEFLPGFASLSHDPMGCRSRRSSAQTKEEMLVLRVCICQEAFCDKGKDRLNLVRNAESLRAKLPLPPLLKDRLAKSAMLLLEPAIDQGARGELLFAAWRRARARSKRWATREEEAKKRVTHETALVLSHQEAACLFSRESTSCSRTK